MRPCREAIYNRGGNTPVPTASAPLSPKREGMLCVFLLGFAEQKHTQHAKKSSLAASPPAGREYCHHGYKWLPYLHGFHGIINGFPTSRVSGPTPDTPQSTAP